MVIDDGAKFVMETNKKFDLILVDGFNDRAHPGDLNTLPFYQVCRNRLTDQGVMGVNLIGLSRGVLGGFAYIKQAFDDRALMFPSCESGNVIAFATAGEEIAVDLEDMKEHAIELKEKTGLNLLPTVTRLEQAQTCTGGILKI
jgi:spermidine synthase